MKKEILLGAIALLISVGVTAQTTEPIQTQTKTKKQLRIEARQQDQVQDQVQSGDPIMTKTKTATKNNGAAKSARTNRPATVKGTGAGRK